MKLKYLSYKHLIHFMSFSILCLLVYSSSVGIALGQKKPKSVPLNVDIDDKKLCEGSLSASQFCDFYRLYQTNKDSRDEAGKSTALNARNDMILLVRGQIDSYFKMRKDGRSTKIRWFQTLLDFLEIGAATAITIMNGERAKTVVGAALNGFQGGRTAFNKNHQILQQQVLINKMITKRADIFTEIVRSMDKPVRAAKPSDSYSWYEAKNDLRRYLLAGTFNDALDTLVQETGEDAARSERRLAIVEKGLIAGEISADALPLSRRVRDILTKDLKTALAGDAESKGKAEKTLQDIVTALKQENPAIQKAVKDAKISETSSGEAIRTALIQIKGILLEAGDDESIMVVDQTIVDIFEQNK